MGDILWVPGQTDRVYAPHSSDILVIGGGPAGATARNLLAKAGRSAIVVEQDGDGLAPCPPVPYRVRRSPFDQILRRPRDRSAVSAAG